MKKLCLSLRGVRRYFALMMATILMVVELQSPAISQDTEPIQVAQYEYYPDLIVTDEYKELTLGLYEKLLAGQTYRGTASMQDKDAARYSGMYYLDTAVAINNVTRNSDRLSFNGTLSIEDVPSTGYRDLNHLNTSLDFETTFSFDKTNGIKSSSRLINTYIDRANYPQEFKDFDVQFDYFRDTLRLSWTWDEILGQNIGVDFGSRKWTWDVTVKKGTEACSTRSELNEKVYETPAYYFSMLECILGYQDFSLDMIGTFHAALYVDALLRSTSSNSSSRSEYGTISISEIANVLNQHPKSLSFLISTFETSILSNLRVGTAFLGTDYHAPTYSEVEEVWPVLKRQLQPSMNTMTEPCATELSHYLDAAKFYLLQACKAYGYQNISGTIASLNEGFIAADYTDWEASQSNNFQSVVDERIQDFIYETGMILSGMVPFYGTPNQWNNAISNGTSAEVINSEENSISRFHTVWGKAIAYMEEYYPSSRGILRPLIQDTPLSGQQSLLCEHYDEWNRQTENLATNTIIDYVTLSVNDTIGVISGFAAGNLTECPQTQGYSVSEIAKDGKAFFTAAIGVGVGIVAGRAIDEGMSRGFRAACDRLEGNRAHTENPSRNVRSLRKLAIRYFGDLVVRNCQEFITDESGSIPRIRLPSFQNILANPRSLIGIEPNRVKEAFENDPRYDVGPLRHSSQPRPDGFVIRELTPSGDFNGKNIQYHPGTRRHFDGDPYWKISDGADRIWMDMDGNLWNPPPTRESGRNSPGTLIEDHQL